MIKIYDGRNEFYQWDLDRKIVVSDLTVTEVHFCNKTDSCSLVVEVKDGIANVPNILLQTAWPIRVYAYCGSCYTKEHTVFKVVARTKPSDYVYTETEVKRWDKLALDIEETLEECTALNDEVKDFLADTDDIMKELQMAQNHERRITQIERHISNDYFVTDDTTAYEKIVPVNACPYAQLSSINGMTYKETVSKNLINTDYFIRDSRYTIDEYGSITIKAGSDFSWSLIYEEPTEGSYGYLIIDKPLPSGVEIIAWDEDEYGQGAVSGDITSTKLGSPIKWLCLNGYFAEETRIGIMLFNEDIAYQLAVVNTLVDTPVTAIESHSANIITFPYTVRDGSIKDVGFTQTINGVNFLVNTDGSITLNGTATDTAIFWLVTGFDMPGGTYTYSIGSNAGSLLSVPSLSYRSNASHYKNFNHASNNKPITFTITEEEAEIANLSINFYVYANTTFDNVRVYPMLNKGSMAAEYVKYREPITYTIPEALQAINSGKGIIDSNGTVYADTIDFENGKYIQRCETVILTGDEAYTYYTDYHAITTNFRLTRVGISKYALISSAPMTTQFSSNEFYNFQFGTSLDWIENYGIHSVDDWKAYLKAQYDKGTPITITYALAQPIVTDIAEHLADFDKFIEVEGGGALKFVNEHGKAVPSSITYMLKEGSI